MRCLAIGASFSKECRVLFVAVFAVVVLLLLVLQGLAGRMATDDHELSSYAHDYPIVLTWTKFFGSDFAQILSNKSADCPRKCIYSSDERWLNESSVIVFHVRNLHEVDLPRTTSRQLKVFYSLEAPPNTDRSVLRRVPSNYFNATATYRADSDFRIPYGGFVARNVSEKAMEGEIREIIKRKSKIVYQMASNCDTWSNREALTAELQNYLNLTSYGSCFGRSCDSRCAQEALESHYFYLAFENSVCPDYVTEKFFRLDQGIVPVVLSRKVMEHVAPSDSFIAVDDFDSPRDLAEYLIFVASHPDVYAKYFEWRRSFEVAKADYGSCQLCEAAYSNRTSTVEDISRWWFDGKCFANYAALGLPSRFSTFARDFGVVFILVVVFVILFITDLH
ncbi:hypothetical protein QR680_017755 [Steinernema hermaphroditum]|uniref:Fucosyltransferase n=1 Tax=Steinernema hermaphroditum TaxID=289476 RepID=A0AA39HFP2_9BILA|nr:hypothetical protein QR680_017755 [Steinernema hermaphroditum]